MDLAWHPIWVNLLALVRKITTLDSGEAKLGHVYPINQAN